MHKPNGKWHDHDIFQTTANKTLVQLYTTHQNLVHLEHIDNQINAYVFIFASKHQSKSGIPSLSVHAPGNWSSADLGGQPNTLCIWPATVTNCLYHELRTLVQNRINIDIIFEATHHGPTLNTPCCFAEIGSTQQEWMRDDLGEVMAKAILYTCSVFPTHQSLQEHNKPVCMGIGGLHTAPRFTSLVNTKSILLSHVCPHYQLQNLTKEMILQALNKSMPKITTILVDWKGLKDHKQHISNILEQLNEPSITIQKIK